MDFGSAGSLPTSRDDREKALREKVQENCENGGGGNITTADFFILRENCKGNITLQEKSLTLL